MEIKEKLNKVPHWIYYVVIGVVAFLLITTTFQTCTGRGVYDSVKDLSRYFLEKEITELEKERDTFKIEKEGLDKIIENKNKLIYNKNVEIAKANDKLKVKREEIRSESPKDIKELQDAFDSLGLPSHVISK